MPVSFWNTYYFPRGESDSMELSRHAGIIHKGGQKPYIARDLPAGWNITYDSRGRRYYYNNDGDTRWSHPSLPQGWSEATDIETQRTYYFHRSGAPSQWSFPEGTPAVYDRRSIEQDTESTNKSTALAPGTTTTNTTSSRGQEIKNNDIIDAYLAHIPENRCRRTCHKDQCEGSIMGAIPRGQTWLMKTKHVSEKGCCFLLMKACDLCCEPPSQIDVSYLRRRQDPPPPPPELEDIGIFPGRPRDSVDLREEEILKCPEGCLTCDEVSRGGYECLTCKSSYKLIHSKGKRGRCIERAPRVESSSSSVSTYSHVTVENVPQYPVRVT